MKTRGGLQCWYVQSPKDACLAQTNLEKQAAESYPNVQLIPAYMPDPFGTHHTKMMILFRHDDFAQVVIHTANMIEQVSKDAGN